MIFRIFLITGFLFFIMAIKLILEIMVQTFFTLQTLFTLTSPLINFGNNVSRN